MPRKSSGSSKLRIPRVLGGYLIERPLSRGGDGTVYLAHPRNQDRSVAIKVPHAAELTSGRRFSRKARLVKRLDHRNIVKVVESGVHSGYCYVVYEYVEGLTFSEWREHKQPSWTDIAKVVGDVAGALAHAHSRGVLHRDVKPENIIVTKDRRPVLVDFDIAVACHESRRSCRGVFEGTPEYASPEQAAGRSDIDGRFDTYSLGAVLYEGLTGRPPFVRPADETDPKRRVREVLRQIREEEPQPPRQIVDAIPPELERICLKAMAKKLKDRYGTAAEMARELRMFAPEAQAMTTFVVPELEQGTGLLGAIKPSLGQVFLSVMRMMGNALTGSDVMFK